MDEIQKVLVKAGRKDLAQKYYLKIAVVKAANDWTIGSDGRRTELTRGKTFPSIVYEQKTNKLYVNDNEKHPSKTYDSNDISLNGIKSLLKHISKPHPTMSDMQEFLTMIETSLQFKKIFRIK